MIDWIIAQQIFTTLSFPLEGVYVTESLLLGLSIYDFLHPVQCVQ